MSEGCKCHLHFSSDAFLILSNKISPEICLAYFPCQGVYMTDFTLRSITACETTEK